MSMIIVLLFIFDFFFQFCPKVFHQNITYKVKATGLGHAVLATL